MDNFTFQEKPKLWKWFILAAILVVLDQITKFWCIKTIFPGEEIVLAPFLNLIITYNKGAAFSFLASQAGWQRYFFTAISVVAVIAIIVYMKKHAHQTFFCLALAFILGGAFGNLIDRLFFGQVTDFIDFHVGAWHWPAFNVADSAITIGAILFVLDEILRKRSR